MDPADFKTYVFPMLFWKWLSDTWLHEHAEAVEEYGDDLTAEVEAEFHDFILPDGTRWDDVTNDTTGNLGANIQKALTRIEQANPTYLSGIFGDAARANKERLPEPALVGVINKFNEITLNPTTVTTDLLGRGYEYLLKNFADESGKKAGEFFTPRAVVNLLVNILEPEPGESLYDPTSGSGGMLVTAINHLRANGKDARTLRVFGQEVNLTTASIAKMNLFLHDPETFDIKRGDTLRDPKFRNPDGTLTQFDTVPANPPFSLSGWGAEKWPADPRAFCGVPPATKGDYAFVQHMITSMKPVTGRVGVVMPHGVLFRGGEEGRIRQCPVEKDLLEAVIGLPPNLFYSTSIPACLLIFRAEGSKRAERKNHVLFVDGSARFAKGRNMNSMSDDDITVLTEAYKTGDDPDGPDFGANVRLVPFDEIKTNGFDLNIGRYIKVAAEEQADLGTLIVAYQEAKTVRVAAEAHMNAVLTAAGIEGFDD
ncbi:type I restriction-modification system subunit M [Nocardioides sp. B-3]|nr:type I restriction-modification system subunit M [Nocardioides sp. B-3]